MQRPPEGEAIPILVQPVIITEGPPKVEDIAAEVQRLRMVRGEEHQALQQTNLRHV